jgi:hypothetical protein
VHTDTAAETAAEKLSGAASAATGAGVLVPATAALASSSSASSARFPRLSAVLSRVLSFLLTRVRLSLAAAFPFAFAPHSSFRLPLDRHALGCVFGFLSLRELAAALSVSKEWTAAVHSTRPSMLTAHIPSDALDALLSSRLRRHVRQLGRNTK